MPHLPWSDVFCPKCRAYSTVTPAKFSQPFWIMPAKAVVVAGAAASALAAYLLLIYATRPLFEFLESIEALQGPPRGGARSVKGLIAILAYVVLFIVALIPGLICARAAAAMPKARSVSCSECRWKGTQMIPPRRRPVMEEEVEPDSPDAPLPP